MNEKFRKVGRAVCGMSLLGLSAVLACLAGGCSRSDEVGRAGPSPVAAGGKSELLALRAENDALRRENQMLRRELVSKNGVLPESVLPEKGTASEPAVEPAGEDTGYWLSSKTKVRHNRRCRNYRKVNGRPCGPNDGRPCKTCGG